MASRVNPVISETFNLFLMLVVWCPTVFGLRFKSSAISLTVLLSANKRKTSNSLGDNSDSGSPSVDDLDLTWSVGSGYRFKRTFLDLGYRQGRINSSYTPYLLSSDSDYSQQEINSKEITHDFVLTFGVKF